MGTGAKVTYYGDVIAFFFIESPTITEQFDKGTRIIVERHYTVGQQLDQFVGIEGTAGSTNALSCIGDPTYKYGFLVHANNSLFSSNDSFSCLNGSDIFISSKNGKKVMRPALISVSKD